jgi:hypothetical protein
MGTAGYLMFGDAVYDEVSSLFFSLYSSSYLTRERLGQSELASCTWVQPYVKQAGTLDACCDTLVGQDCALILTNKSNFRAQNEICSQHQAAQFCIGSLVWSRHLRSEQRRTRSSAKIVDNPGREAQSVP